MQVRRTSDQMNRESFKSKQERQYYYESSEGNRSPRQSNLLLAIPAEDPVNTIYMQSAQQEREAHNADEVERWH